MSDIAYFKKNGQEIEKEQVRIVEELIGETLFEGDERRALIKAQSYGFALLGQYIDHKARNNFLKTCTEETVNDFGDFKKIERQKTEKALTTFKFKRQGNLNNAQAIAKGTRVGVGSIVFQTTETKEFILGSTEVLVNGECLEAGTIGNGFLPGQINALIDIDPYITGAENVTTSNGGSDYEDIEIYKQKIREAPEGYSVAGPEGAYKFFAKKADSNISDVHIDSPSPCIVDIYVLMKGGVLPSQEILQKVELFCSDKTIRPLNDLVRAKEPQSIEYSIDLSFYIPRSLETLANSIKTRVNEEIQNFILETKERLGRDVNPDDLIVKLKNAGCKRAVINSPSFISVNNTESARGLITNVRFAGVEDD